MHKNRLEYSLEEYQSKLRNSAKVFGMIFFRPDTSKAFFYKPKPKSIWVPEFQPEYLRIRKAKLRQALLSQKYAFYTLTYWTAKYTPEDCASVHKAHIKRFIRLLREKFGRVDFSYVVEVTENLYVHFHIFMNKEFSRNTIKKLWYRVSGSYIVDKVNLNNIKIIVNYVNKYVNKIAGDNIEKLRFMFDRIDRFFASSQGFFKNVKRDTEKIVYKMLCFAMLDARTIDDIIEQGLEDKPLDFNCLVEALTKYRLSFYLKYSNTGALVLRSDNKVNTNDFIDFWYKFLFTDNSDFSAIVHNEMISYYNY